MHLFLDMFTYVYLSIYYVIWNILVSILLALTYSVDIYGYLHNLLLEKIEKKICK